MGRNAPRLVALPPRTSTHPKTNMIAIQRATLCLCLLSSLLAGGMGKRTLFQGIDPVSDIEQGLQGVGQDLLNMFDGGTMIVQEGGLDTIDTTLLDELEQEPDACERTHRRSGLGTLGTDGVQTRAARHQVRRHCHVAERGWPGAQHCVFACAGRSG